MLVCMYVCVCKNFFLSDFQRDAKSLDRELSGRSAAEEGGAALGSCSYCHFSQQSPRNSTNLGVPLEFYKWSNRG